MTIQVSHLRAYFISATISVLSGYTLNAQVTIREKVIIVPKPGVAVMQAAPPSGRLPSTLLMPKKGTIVVYYNQAQRLGTVLPSTAKLFLERRRVDTVASDGVAARFYHVESVINSTCSPSLNEYHYSQQGLPGIQQPFSAMKVQQGDTLLVGYVTDLYPSDGVSDTLAINPPYDSSSSGFTVTFGQWDNCYSTWREELGAFIGVFSA